jgi:predicted NAD/FAD-binding protein
MPAIDPASASHVSAVDRRVDKDAQTRRLVRQLERLGHQVSLEPAEGAQPAEPAAGAEAAA